MGEKIFGEIQTTEDLNELAKNLRTTKEFDEIRLLCSENGVSEKIAEEFIKGDRLLLVENRNQKVNHGENHGEELTEPQSDIGRAIESIERSAFDMVTKDEDEIKAAEKEQKALVVYTVEDVRKKLGEELKIYKDGDSKYVVDKLIELCCTDEMLRNAIMLPHKSYDKAFQYFYQQSRNVGYTMPHGNMVYLDNDKAVELSVEYFKRDDAAEEKKKTQKKVTPKQRDKAVSKDKTKTEPKPEKKNGISKAGIDKPPVKKEQDTKQKKKNIDGQMSLFDY